MILMMVINKTMAMEEVFLMYQFWTIRKSGNKDNVMKRDIIMHLFFLSFVGL